MSGESDKPKYSVIDSKGNRTPITEDQYLAVINGEIKADGLRPDGLASPVDYRFDLIPPEALMKIAQVMYEGDVTGHKPDGWKKMNTVDLVNHAMGHLVKHLQGKVDEDHLSHAMVRCMMAWWVEEEKNGWGKPYISPTAPCVPRFPDGKYRHGEFSLKEPGK